MKNIFNYWLLLASISYTSFWLPTDYSLRYQLHVFSKSMAATEIQFFIIQISIF